jgi:hypothetical protein
MYSLLRLLMTLFVSFAIIFSLTACDSEKASDKAPTFSSQKAEESAMEKAAKDLFAEYESFFGKFLGIEKISYKFLEPEKIRNKELGREEMVQPIDINVYGYTYASKDDGKNYFNSELKAILVCHSIINGEIDCKPVRSKHVDKKILKDEPDTSKKIIFEKK